MKNIVFIAAGGALGAIARYILSGWVYQWISADFPYGTLVVNLMGTFLLGFFYPLLTEKLAIDPQLRNMITIGCIGAFTTFSTFMMESFRLLQYREYGFFVINIGGSIIGGLMAFYSGMVLGRLL